MTKEIQIGNRLRVTPEFAFKRTVTKSGNGAALGVPRKYLGYEAIVLVLAKPKKTVQISAHKKKSSQKA